MNVHTKDDIKQWYNDSLATYDGLTNVVCSILESLLNKEGIEYLYVSGRTKSLKSVLEKFGRKNYINLQAQMTDISGVRVITYIEDGVSRTCEIIRNCFDVDEGNSLDKSKNLGTDRIGYRSVHFVSHLGSDRTALPEFDQYRGYPFEIQVRTVLQHAWAEIEHDRRYKFSMKLPSDLERELFLISGQLEMADRAFSQLSEKIDNYSLQIEKDKDKEDFNAEIDSISLAKVMPEVVSLLKKVIIDQNKQQGYNDYLVDILRRFGVRTTSEFKELLGDEFLRAVDENATKLTPVQLVSSAMVYKDINKYFSLFGNDTSEESFGLAAYNIIKSKYGPEKTDTVLSRHFKRIYDFANSSIVKEYS